MKDGKKRTKKRFAFIGDFIYLHTAYHNIYVFVKYSSIIFPCPVGDFIFYMYPIFLYPQKRRDFETDSQYFYPFARRGCFGLEHRDIYTESGIFSGKYDPIVPPDHHRLFVVWKKFHRCRRYQTCPGSLTLFPELFIATDISRKYSSHNDHIYYWIYHRWISPYILSERPTERILIISR